MSERLVVRMGARRVGMDVLGGELAYISHAHTDHCAALGGPLPIFCSDVTADILGLKEAPQKKEETAKKDEEKTEGAALAAVARGLTLFGCTGSSNSGGLSGGKTIADCQKIPSSDAAMTMCFAQVGLKQNNLSVCESAPAGYVANGYSEMANECSCDTYTKENYAAACNAMKQKGVRGACE